MCQKRKLKLQLFAAASWVKKADWTVNYKFPTYVTNLRRNSDRQLHISDRWDYGCSKFQFVPQNSQNGSFFNPKNLHSNTKFFDKKKVWWQFFNSPKIRQPVEPGRKGNCLFLPRAPGHDASTSHQSFARRKPKVKLDEERISDVAGGVAGVPALSAAYQLAVMITAASIKSTGRHWWEVPVVDARPRPHLWGQTSGRAVAVKGVARRPVRRRRGPVGPPCACRCRHPVTDAGSDDRWWIVRQALNAGGETLDERWWRHVRWKCVGGGSGSIFVVVRWGWWRRGGRRRGCRRAVAVDAAVDRGAQLAGRRRARCYLVAAVLFDQLLVFTATILKPDFYLNNRSTNLSS